MFLISLIDYHRLIDTVHWAYGVGILSLVAVALFGTKVLSENIGTPFPRRSLPTIRVDQAHPYRRRRPLLLGFTGRDLLADIGKVSAMVFVTMAFVLKQPDLGTSLAYLPILICGLFLAASTSTGCNSSCSPWSPSVVSPGRAANTSSPTSRRVSTTVLVEPRLRPARLPLSIRQSLIAVGAGESGQGHQQGNTDSGDFSPFPIPTSSSPPSAKNTSLRRRRRRSIAVFPHPHATHQNAQTASNLRETSSSWGWSRRYGLFGRGQCRNGRRADLRSLNTLPVGLGGSFGPTHLPRPRHRYKHPHMSRFVRLARRRKSAPIKAGRK